MAQVFFPTLPPDTAQAMQRFDELYLESLQSEVPTIALALTHLRRGLGKRLRPLIVILTAECYGVQNDRVIRAAVSLELLHMASLIHDDVVDESMTRRGEASFNALLGNHKAVLLGDYILSHAFNLALDLDLPLLVRKMAELGADLSKGELLQLDISQLADTTEEQYLEVIKQKTAALMQGSMITGAAVAEVRDGRTLHALAEASMHLGIAFQIKDDIFDYLPSPELGKPSSNDLKEHKVTLPLIHALGTQGTQATKAQKLLRKQRLSEQEIDFLVNFAIKSGGIDYADKVMRTHIKECKHLLSETLPPSPAKETLLGICDYIVDRDK